jgi:hypothetical protein
MKAFKKSALRVAAATVASGILATGAVALAGAADAATLSAQSGTSYHFQTLDNHRDLAFNQLLGINNEGVIAGYFGSGAQGQPNKGYVLLPPYGQGNYVNENFPGSVQTQVTGLNNRGVTVGFWSSMNNASMTNNNFGWVNVDGHFRTADFPTKTPADPPMDQLLGVNDSDLAVGFWVDGNGNNHGYEYNITTGRYSSVVDPQDKTASLQATAINDRDDIAGTVGSDGFLLTHGGQFITLSAPGASSTMALGVNDSDEVVGAYTVGSGSSAVMHGFTWTPQHGFSTVDDPHGIGTTTINGVNDRGQLVGFYTVDNGNITDGFLATP